MLTQYISGADAISLDILAKSQKITRLLEKVLTYSMNLSSYTVSRVKKHDFLKTDLLKKADEVTQKMVLSSQKTSMLEEDPIKYQRQLESYTILISDNSILNTNALSASSTQAFDKLVNKIIASSRNSTDKHKELANYLKMLSKQDWTELRAIRFSGVAFSSEQDDILSKKLVKSSEKMEG